jgi:hypothetical protein
LNVDDAVRATSVVLERLVEDDEDITSLVVVDTLVDVEVLLSVEDVELVVSMNAASATLWL